MANFKCSHCGHTWSADKAKTDHCPKCNAYNIKRTYPWLWKSLIGIGVVALGVVVYLLIPTTTITYYIETSADGDAVAFFEGLSNPSSYYLELSASHAPKDVTDGKKMTIKKNEFTPGKSYNITLKKKGGKDAHIAVQSGKSNLYVCPAMEGVTISNPTPTVLLESAKYGGVSKQLTQNNTKWEVSPKIDNPNGHMLQYTVDGQVYETDNWTLAEGRHTLVITDQKTHEEIANTEISLPHIVTLSEVQEWMNKLARQEAQPGDAYSTYFANANTPVKCTTGGNVISRGHTISDCYSLVIEASQQHTYYDIASIQLNNNGKICLLKIRVDSGIKGRAETDGAKDSAPNVSVEDVYIE